MRFRTLVVIGDKKGRVGYGVGKGNEVVTAVKKGVNKAKKGLVRIEILDGTIAHDIEGKTGSAKVLLKSAKKGRGIIAGGSVRIVLELAGFNDIVAKSFGSSNKINNVRATINALQSLLKHKRELSSNKTSSVKKQQKDEQKDEGELSANSSRDKKEIKQDDKTGKSKVVKDDKAKKETGKGA